MAKLGQKSQNIMYKTINQNFSICQHEKSYMINLFSGVYILLQNCTACLLQHIKASGR